jgi:hypothetical protein
MCNTAAVVVDRVIPDVPVRQWAADKDGRERLIRYCARPALRMKRMSETGDGLIAYRLRHTQKGRASHRVMRPIGFLARIEAIIPPTRHPLLRYFGVLGPHSSW